MLPIILAAYTSQCAPSPDAYAQLIQNFREQRLTLAMQSDGTVLEVWGNPDSKTWTMLITAPNGTSCAVAAGQGLEIFPVEPNV